MHVNTAMRGSVWVSTSPEAPQLATVLKSVKLGTVCGKANLLRCCLTFDVVMECLWSREIL